MKKIHMMIACLTACVTVLAAGCRSVPENTVHSLSDLEGKKIGVQLKTTGDVYSSDIKDADVQRFNRGSDAVLALRDGEVDAVMLDDAPAEYFVGEYDDLMILDEPYADEEYGIAVSKDNPELLQKINGALATLKSGGVIDRITEAWLEKGESVSAYDAKKDNSYSGGTMLMVTNAEFPPYESITEDGNIVGIDIDIMRAICDELDMKLQVEHTVFDALIASVQRKTADVAMAAMTVNEERLEDVDFSDTYMCAKQVIIVRKK